MMNGRRSRAISKATPLMSVCPVPERFFRPARVNSVNLTLDAADVIGWTGRVRTAGAREQILDRGLDADSRRSAPGRILAVAAERFYLDGIRAVGVDKIIADAEVAKATFYAHYRSKNQLVIAYLEMWDRAWRLWFVEAAQARAGAPRLRLLASFDVLQDMFADAEFRGCAFARALSEVGGELGEVIALATAHKQALAAYLEGNARAAGLRRPGELARRLLLLVDGAMVAAARDRNAEAAVVAKSMAQELVKLHGRGPTQGQGRLAGQASG